MKKQAQDIVAGDVFPSPREEEGIVTAVCGYGACTHERGRDMSVHVRSSKHRSEFFIALPNEEAHICDKVCAVNYGPGHSEANRTLR